MKKLNLPDFDFNIKNSDGKVWIFDVIRKKYIVLTPEEWVRQHFIHYLMESLNYPKALIKVEGGLQFNKLNKRSDIVIFNRQGQPWMLVECKSPELKITESIFHQASTYNATLKAKYLAITNGLNHFCAHINWLENKTTLIKEFPPFEA